MNQSLFEVSVTQRNALIDLRTSEFGITFAARFTAAQEAAPEMSTNPIVGN